TAREAEKIIKEGNILVDGKIERNEKRGLKLMNILEIKKINKAYLVSLDQKQRFYLEEIDLSKAKEKLCKIVNKTTLKKGKIQLNFHDGTNHILDKNAYSCGDVVKMKIPENEIIDVFELKKGNIAKILGGNHAGKIGTIERIIPGTMTREKMIEISDGKNKFLCPEKYVFVIGKGDGDDKNR
ncbi:MAG: 30S ribosomal protein S4e, partial [archaeon]